MVTWTDYAWVETNDKSNNIRTFDDIKLSWVKLIYCTLLMRFKMRIGLGQNKRLSGHETFYGANKKLATVCIGSSPGVGLHVISLKLISAGVRNEYVRLT